MDIKALDTAVVAVVEEEEVCVDDREGANDLRFKSFPLKLIARKLKFPRALEIPVRPTQSSLCETLRYGLYNCEKTESEKLLEIWNNFLVLSLNSSFKLFVSPHSLVRTFGKLIMHYLNRSAIRHSSLSSPTSSIFCQSFHSLSSIS